MQEKALELYQKYLSEQLDIVFNMEKYRADRKVVKPNELGSNQIYAYLNGRKEITDVDGISDFVNGYAVVSKSHIYQTSPEHKEVTSREMWDIINEWHKKMNEIREENLHTSSKWLIPEPRRPDFVTNTYYQFIDKNYRSIIHDWGHYRWFTTEPNDFHYGLASVESAYWPNKVRTYIKEDGKPLLSDDIHDHKIWFGDTYDFLGNVGIVFDKDYQNISFLTQDGRYYKVNGPYTNFNVGWGRSNYKRTRFDQELVYTRENGKKLERKSTVYTNRSFIVLNKYDYEEGKEKNIFSNVVCISGNIKDYTFQKKHFNYVVSNSKDKFKLKYEPIRIYDGGFVICKVNDETLSLYDRNNNTYTPLGTIYDTWFDNNLIVNYDGDKVINASLIYNGKLIDITYYYKNSLMDVENFEQLNKNVELKTFDEYYSEYEDKIRRERREELLKEDAKKAMELEQEKVKELTEIKQSKEELMAKHEDVKNEGLSYIFKGLEILDNYQKATGKVERIDYKDIFIEVNGHKEIKPIILLNGLLRIINLSTISFENVKVTGVDFRGCNVNLDPQEVYDKDLTGCNFEGVYFPVSVDFTNVKVYGCKFTNKNITTTFDLRPNNFENALYDENTTLNDIPIGELLDVNENKQRRA